MGKKIEKVWIRKNNYFDRIPKLEAPAWRAKGWRVVQESDVPLYAREAKK